MKIWTWIAVAITYVLLVSLVMLVSYILGHIWLRMPLMDVYILTGSLMFATTVGMVVAIMIFLAKRKK
jgi:hypothetical protein